MCYPRERPGRFIPPDEGQRGVAREQVEIQVISREVSNGNGSSAEAGMMKQCVCSPTQHPGSFRCRHHHADYKWAAQLGTNKINDH
ncbi:hypothetical protein RDI58_015985 [Solanum bulbocastanum]|uniref:Uncharacterized protein n=1 Tax=Solanum bulbocastanum TaxID=147425 RepID=A0AAN8TGL5_SOLBU